MTEFPTRRVDRSHAQAVEPLGSKPKFWFREGGSRLLFKAEERGTGEDWAEVVACYLCRLLGLPHVDYELAVECDGKQEIRPGVVCVNMAPPPLTLVLGNELLLGVDPLYPRDERSKYKVRQHTAEAVCDVVSTLALPDEQWTTSLPAGIQSALEVFTGYVMLDAWIANQDRHHENWGAIRENDTLRLAPTFDHAAGLARNLSDSEREDRLTTKDHGRSIAAFVRRGRSAFYRSAADTRALELCEAFQAFAERVPQAKNVWLDRLRAVNTEAVQGILERVPIERMSDTCKRFTLELLLTNQTRLLE